MKITLSSGVEVEDAYVKITNCNGNSKKISVILNAFRNRDAMEDGYPAIEGYNVAYTFTPTLGQNVKDFITQGYDYVKTQPGFEGATDVLEDGQTA